MHPNPSRPTFGHEVCWAGDSCLEWGWPIAWAHHGQRSQVLQFVENPKVCMDMIQHFGFHIISKVSPEHETIIFANNAQERLKMIFHCKVAADMCTLFLRMWISLFRLQLSLFRMQEPTFDGFQGLISRIWELNYSKPCRVWNWQ